jgi:hypothetical protein
MHWQEIEVFFYFYLFVEHWMCIFNFAYLIGVLLLFYLVSFYKFTQLTLRLCIGDWVLSFLYSQLFGRQSRKRWNGGAASCIGGLGHFAALQVRPSSAACFRRPGDVPCPDDNHISQVSLFLPHMRFWFQFVLIWYPSTSHIFMLYADLSVQIVPPSMLLYTCSFLFRRMLQCFVPFLMSQIKLWMLCWVVSGKKTVVHFWFDGTMDVIHDRSKMFFLFLDQIHVFKWCTTTLFALIVYV